jgi:hypothetical protein
VNDLLEEWRLWQNTQNSASINSLWSVCDDIFSGNSNNFPWEYCDFVEYVDLGESWPFANSCDSSLGFFGIDSPTTLLDIVMEELATDVGDIVIMNGDFIGHDRTAPKNADQT